MVMCCSAGRLDDVMGGVHCVLVPAFFQLPPVMDNPLYTLQEVVLSVTDLTEVVLLLGEVMEHLRQVRTYSTCWGKYF